MSIPLWILNIYIYLDFKVDCIDTFHYLSIFYESFVICLES